jgi:hypothetical protein
MLESRERDYKLSDPLRNYKNARVLPGFRHDVDPGYMQPARFLAERLRWTKRGRSLSVGGLRLLLRAAVHSSTI